MEKIEIEIKSWLQSLDSYDVQIMDLEKQCWDLNNPFLANTNEQRKVSYVLRFHEMKFQKKRNEIKKMLKQLREERTACYTNGMAKLAEYLKSPRATQHL